MKIEKNQSLKDLNTFGLESFTAEYVNITSLDILKEALEHYKDQEVFILSGGSNMLLTGDLDKPVLHINIKGIETIQTDKEQKVLIKANAGEIWHDFVLFCVENNYGGLENLSLIPGYVGSAPIQNIGAYGTELKDTFVQCEAIHIKSGKKTTFTKEDCKFGYRNSIFKQEKKGQYIITSVTFLLTTTNHKTNTSYGAIEQELELKKKLHPTIKDISDAVISIRKSKLPDPKEIGNSGSFFKNPVVFTNIFEKIQEKYPDMPFYTIDKKFTKIPAGWLIEKCGFKGKRWGDVGVHQKQALVLVNYGNAKGKEVLELSEKIQKKVFEQFGITLESEVNII